MTVKDLEQNGLEVTIGANTIKLKGHFKGNLFCIDRGSIDNHPFLTEMEKDELIRCFKSDKNMLLSDK